MKKLMRRLTRLTMALVLVGGGAAATAALADSHYLRIDRELGIKGRQLIRNILDVEDTVRLPQNKRSYMVRVQVFYHLEEARRYVRDCLNYELNMRRVTIIEGTELNYWVLFPKFEYRLSEQEAAYEVALLEKELVRKDRCPDYKPVVPVMLEF